MRSHFSVSIDEDFCAIAIRAHQNRVVVILGFGFAGPFLRSLRKRVRDAVSEADYLYLPFRVLPGGIKLVRQLQSRVVRVIVVKCYRLESDGHWRIYSRRVGGR